MSDLGNPELAGDAWSKNLGGDVQPPAPKFAVNYIVVQADASEKHGRRTRITERSLQDGGAWSYFTPAFGWQLEDYYRVPKTIDIPIVGRKITVDPQAQAEVDKIDMVNHPPHYQSGKYEVIEVLEEFFPNDPLLWQVGKYTMRAGKKGDTVEDLKKARWYLDRRIAKAEED